MRAEDILRKEIAKSFFKLIVVYMLGSILFLILSALFIVTAILVPLRYKENIQKFTILVQKIRIKAKNPDNVKLMLSILRDNFVNCFYDWGVIFTFLLFTLTALLVVHRFLSTKLWFSKVLIPCVKENLKLK